MSRMIMNRFRRLIKDDCGQAMIAALVCMVLGALVVTPSVSYAATSLNSVSIKESSLRGGYAAEAGIEKVLWVLKYGQPIPTSLPQAVNGADVTITTVSKGNYTLVAGEWVTTAEHTEYLLVSSSNITWDASHNGYKYELTITWTGDGNCWLTGVGDRLPFGYDYQAESVHFFAGNLSTDEPSDEVDGEGSHIRSWTFPTKIKLESPETRTQTFIITGSGNLEDYYGWAEGERQDVGPSGELSGGFYIITATATRGGTMIGKIEANAMVSGSNVYITSWRILK